MSKKTNGAKKFVLAIIAAIAACALLNSEYLFAEQGEGGNVGGSCGGKSYYYTAGSGYGVCSDDGYGWVHFKYAPGMKRDINFGPASANSGGIKTVSSKCADYGGFWHYGFYVQKNLWHHGSSYAYTDVYMNGYSTAGNPEHQYGSSNRDLHYSDFSDSQLSHKFYTSDGELIAYADYKKRDSDVKTEYYDWLNKFGYSQGESDIWDSTLSWFCYGDGVKNSGASFTGSTTIYVDGSPVGNGTTLTKSSATVTFSHNVKRGNDGKDGAVTNHYRTTVSSDPSGYGTALPKTNSGFTKGQEKNVKTDSFPVSVSYGSTVTVCQTLYYDSKVKDDGTVESTANTGNNCVKFKRPAGGDFTAKQSCSVDAAGQHKGNECNKGYDTNSQKWKIYHESWINGNSGGTVPSGKTGTSNSHYSHGNLTYGTGSQCERSYKPYTYYWYYVGGSLTSEGPTLHGTSTQDLPDGHPGENNYHWNGTYHDGDCNKWGDEICKYDSKGKKIAGSCYKPCTGHKQEKTYVYYYPGCESGKTYWQDYDNKKQTKNWEKDNDSDLLLGNGQNDYKTAPSKCTSISARASYSGGSWSGTTSSSACNWITRWRRHVHFKQGDAEIKADSGTHSSASTTRSNNYDLNTTGSDGKFTITFTYFVNRTNTDNVKDTGAENYQVKNKWKTKETIEAADGSGQTYNINRTNGTYNTWVDRGEFTSNQANKTNVSGKKTVTVQGTLYYGQKVKICGVLHYGDKVRELDNNGSEIEHETDGTAGCVYVHRDVKKCDEFSNAVISHQQGDNMAKIGVMNKSIGMTNYAYTTWNYNQGRINTASPNITSVWARPGDNIRYDVQYCMAANYSDAVHLIDGHPISGRNANDTNQDTKLYMKGNSEARDRFTGKVDEVRRSHYLFGKEVSTHDSIDYKNDKTIPITFPYIYRENNGTVKQQSISDSTTIGGKKSPSSSMGTTYSCPNDGVASSSSSYYQIAGKVINTAGTYDSPDGYDFSMNDRYTINGCGSNRTQSLDVGRELSESLMWTNLSVKVSGGVSYGTYRADYASQAYVRVPYNYTAKPFLKNNSKPEGTVQIGGKMMVTPGIAVFPRKNCAFLNGFGTTLTRPEQCSGNNSYSTYATVTKPTKVTYTPYYVDDNNAWHKISGQEKSIVVRANTQSNLSGAVGHPTGRGNSGGPELDDDLTIDVPNNIDPGDQVCIKMTITPADSHNNPSAAVVMGASLNYAAAEDTSNHYKTFWALREDGTNNSSAYATTCSTAVKRPTVSIEDSNLYSATNVTTSVISRWNNSDSNPKYYLFGSWSEYGIFGNVKTATKGDSVSTLGMASGASYGYNQSGYNHRTTVTGYNPLPLTVITYNKGPKNGTYHYNYNRITAPNTQRVIVYNYATKDDGSHYYQLASNTTHTIYPSTYTFANAPIVNASDTVGTAPNNSKICNHATQTFANNECDSGKLGSNKVGADAAKTFYESILDRYKTDTVTKTDSAPRIGSYIDITNFYAEAKQFDNTDDEDAALYKNVGNGKAFLGYSSGADLDLSSLTISLDKDAGGTDTYLGRTANSVIVYQADTIVINSSIIANADEKKGPNDFRMPIIIANKVWFTGTPKRIDAIIIAKEELNTCKWNNYNSFVNNVLPSFPTGTAQHDSAGNTLYTLWSNKSNEMGSNICTNELRFTAPVIVKGKVVLNRTSGGGNGGDQYRRAEIFELNPATYLWSYYEMSRYSQATTTYSRELPSRY